MNLHTKYSLWLLLLVYCILCNEVYGQSSQYKNYSVKDGLPSSEVYNVMQDSKGYMWFGTDHGACRFDGYTFRSFSLADGLPDPMVLECIEDHKGRIWFCSLSGRLSYFYHDSIFQLPVNNEIVKLLKRRYITYISVDTTDCIYIGAYNTHTVISINLRKNCAISSINIPADVIYVIQPPSGEPIMGNTTEPNIVPQISYTIATYSIKSDTALLLEKGNKWDVDAGPFTYNGSHNMAINLPDGTTAFSSTSMFLILNRNKISFQYTLEAPILKLYADKTGGIWIILQDGAPVRYFNGTITRQPIFEALAKRRITSLCIDNEGGIWLSTLNSGVFYISIPDIKTWDMENGLPGNKVTIVSTGPDSSMAVSTEGNQAISFLHNDSITSYEVPRRALSSVAGFLFMPDNTFWIGTTLGVYILKKNNSPQFLSRNTQIISNGLIPNPDGSVWNNGHSTIDLLQRRKDSIEIIKRYIIRSRIFSFCRSIAGGLWIGTIDGLLELKHDSIINYTHVYPQLSNGIESMQEAPGGYLWMAMRDTGIIMKKGNTFIHLTTTEGLLSDFCKCLCIDYKGNIWVGSKAGISHITVHTGNSGQCYIDAIKNITNDNLIEVNTIVCKRNIVYAGTNNGLTAFDMDKIESNKTPPPIYITSIKINNKNVSSPIYMFNLHYDENFISLNFLGIAYRNAGNIEYRYKLEGIDTGWIYSKFTTVQYPKLAPGNYTFSVSAMNNDGVWSTVPAKATFIIAPPFWATWWARVSMVLIIAALIYWRIKEVEKREKRKTEVNKQLATFELKELKAQLDPHFLFNSLNTLTHLVEKAPANAPEFVEELSQFYRYTLMHRNSEFTTLQAEIEQAERYLKLLRIRFGDQLSVSWRVNEPYKTYLVPTNSLQLLFENITKHNVILPEMPLGIDIITTDGNTLVIKNQLRLKKVPALSNGIGLKSISDRYRLLVNKKINIVQTAEYFSVELPLISPEEYEDINY